MKTQRLYLLLFICFYFPGNLLKGQCLNPRLYEAKAVTFDTPCLQADYHEVYFEDFKEGQLDENIWHTYIPTEEPYKRVHVDDSPNVILDRNVYVENGLLHLRALEEEYTHSWYDEDGIYQEITKPYSVSMIYSNNQTDQSNHASGCWNQGKFSIRAKTPTQTGINSAFWFFGWPGEIDVFEFFDGPDGKLSTNIHLWHLHENDTHPVDHKKFNLGNLSADFHVYTFEWTPFKWEWSLDGEVFRTIYRYYRLETVPNSVPFCRPITCDNVDELLHLSVQVREHKAWEHYDDFNVDMIVGPLIDVDNLPTGTLNTEMLVDWIKIEQRNKCNWEILGEEELCPGEPGTFSISCEELPTSDFNHLNWTVSSNLVITGYESDNSGVFVEALSFPTSNKAWVKVENLKNENGCVSIELEKSINVEAGTPINGFIQQHPLPDVPLSSVNFVKNRRFRVVMNNPGIFSYDWDLIAGNADYQSLDNGATVNIEFPAGSSSATFTVEVPVDCGVSKRTLVFVLTGGWFGANPNPVETQLTINAIPAYSIEYTDEYNLLQSILIDPMIERLDIYSVNTGQLAFSEQYSLGVKTVNVDWSSFPSGEYSVKIEHEYGKDMILLMKL